MDRQEALAFADRWIAAWNVRDIDAIVAMFHENATFRSPFAGEYEGDIVRGHHQLRAYWGRSRERNTFRFVLDHTLWDRERQELSIVYSLEIDRLRGRACEMLRFGEGGLVTHGEAMYGSGMPFAHTRRTSSAES